MMCQHRLDPETMEFVAVTEGGVEIEGRCDCGAYLFDKVPVEQMAEYERGGA